MAAMEFFNGESLSSLIEAAEYDAGCLVGKPINQMLLEELRKPAPKFLWKRIWVEGEVICLFADTNVGKSILAIQVADEIARAQEKPVIYVDCELSGRQFAQRYSWEQQPHQFTENFIRVCPKPDVEITEERIISSIESYIALSSPRAVIIDNLTWVCANSERGADAAAVMMKLMALKRKYGVSLMIIAHTPKRDESQPITLNHLAGSKRLANFFDAIIALGRSAKDNGLRYVKQLKSRCEFQFSGDDVLVGELLTEDDFLRFLWRGVESEKDHLREPTESDSGALKAEVQRLKAEGKSFREISGILNISKDKAQRVFRKE